MRRRLRPLGLALILACLGAGPARLTAQPGGDFGEETILYAETKQVNQFFRRFNAEEGRDGERFYADNPLYRNPEFRQQYLDLLFDNESGLVQPAAKKQFIRDVCQLSDPVYLEFHGGSWIAELQTRFLYEGSERDLTLFLRLEADRLGHKWVIERVFFKPYYQRFSRRPAGEQEFLHPLSHELDFMNLSKVFRSSRDLQGYLPAGYAPDQLTLFLLDVQEGKLQFRTVKGLQFHFFQVEGWYFQLSDVQRSGYNTGWLITHLEKLGPEQRNSRLQAIYDGGK
jgi:hypothetical protein